MVAELKYARREARGGPRPIAADNKLLSPPNLCRPCDHVALFYVTKGFGIILNEANDKRPGSVYRTVLIAVRLF